VDVAGGHAWIGKIACICAFIYAQAGLGGGGTK